MQHARYMERALLEVSRCRLRQLGRQVNQITLYGPSLIQSQGPVFYSCLVCVVAFPSSQPGKYIQMAYKTFPAVGSHCQHSGQVSCGFLQTATTWATAGVVFSRISDSTTGYTFTTCGIFYFPWHRHQIEGSTGF